MVAAQGMERRREQGLGRVQRGHMARRPAYAATGSRQATPAAAAVDRYLASFCANLIRHTGRQRCSAPIASSRRAHVRRLASRCIACRRTTWAALTRERSGYCQQPVSVSQCWTSTPSSLAQTSRRTRQGLALHDSSALPCCFQV